MPPINTDGKSEENYFIGLALSGGSSQTLFSAAVMLRLHDSVSWNRCSTFPQFQGSLPAAYYALYQNEQNGRRLRGKGENAKRCSQNFEEWAVNYQVRSPARWITDHILLRQNRYHGRGLRDFLYADAKKFSDLRQTRLLLTQRTMF